MIRCLLIIFCILILANCSSSPEPQYYTLSAIAGNSQTNCSTNIKLRRPVIPQTLDRPEMVTQNGEFQIEENDYNLWPEPLDRMIERVLAEDLRLRLPHGIITTESSGANLKAAFTVDTDIQQFGNDADGKAILQAQSIVYKSDKAEKSSPVLLHGEAVTSPELMAKNLSILLGNFADNIVNNTCK